MAVLEGHCGSVRSVRFAPDGRTLVSTGLDGRVLLWDLAQRKELARLEPRLGPLFAVAESTTHIVAAGDAGTTVLWDRTRRREAVRLFGFPAGNWVTLTPEGHFDGSADGFNYLNVRIGEEVHSLEQFAESYYRPDLVRIALGGAPVPVPDAQAAAAAERQRAAQEAGRARREEQARIARAEAERRAAEQRAQAERERLAQAERDRLAQVERERLAQAERERLARLERERQAAAERERQERERAARAEQEKLERERQAQQQLAALKREQQPAAAPARPERRLTEVRPAPQVAFVDAPATTGSDTVELRLAVADQGGGIGDVRVYLNGTAVVLDATRNLQVQAGQAPSVLTYRLRVVQGKNQVRAVAFNSENTMQSRDAIHEFEAKLSGPKRPSLHALVIGIKDFVNPALRLRFTVADAELFAGVLQRQTRTLFENVNVKLLVTPEETTRSAIVSAIEAMQKQVGPEDLFVFYAASHGTVDEEKYYSITSNVGSTSTRALRADAIDQNKLKELLGNVPATKKLIVMDTCNAGKLADAGTLAFNTRGLSEDRAIKVLGRAVGVTTLYASTDLQEALEGYEGHGLFTWVITQGLLGKADADRDGFVKTIELADYVDNEVPELAERVFSHKQFPVVAPSGMGFPVTSVTVR